MNNSPSESVPRLVVVAASAGGLVALETFLSHLPKSFPAPLVIVLHLSPDHRSMMAEVLGRYTDMRVKQVEEGDTLRAGTVYCAPPDFHVLVTDERKLTLTHTVQVQYVRPSADALFESAAQVYGAGVVAVVLSGTGRDGKNGVEVVKERGGVTLAQDEASAQHFGMPKASIETGVVDFVLPLEELATKVLELTSSNPEPDTKRTVEETP